MMNLQRAIFENIKNDINFACICPAYAYEAVTKYHRFMNDNRIYINPIELNDLQKKVDRLVRSCNDKEAYSSL